MKRTIISAAVLALGFAGAGVSLAEPQPNGNNNYGLCRAYLAHDGNGNGQPRPFQEMAAAWEAADEGDRTFLDYCTELVNDGTPGNSTGGHTNNGGGNGGGKPEKP